MTKKEAHITEPSRLTERDAKRVSDHVFGRAPLSEAEFADIMAKVPKGKLPTRLSVHWRDLIS